MQRSPIFFVLALNFMFRGTSFSDEIRPLPKGCGFFHVDLCELPSFKAHFQDHIFCKDYMHQSDRHREKWKACMKTKTVPGQEEVEHVLIEALNKRSAKADEAARQMDPKDRFSGLILATQAHKQWIKKHLAFCRQQCTSDQCFKNAQLAKACQASCPSKLVQACQSSHVAKVQQPPPKGSKK